MSPNLRRILHVWVADVLYYSAALTIWRWFRRRMLHKDVVCVLGLHRVLTRDEQERSNSLDGMVIREDTYLKLLAHVQKRFQVLSLDSFLNIAEQPGVPSRPQCLITFDDGWADTYSRAYSGLTKFRLPAVVFLATGSIGSSGGFWVEQVRKAWRTPAGKERIEAVFRDALAQPAKADLEAVVDWLKRMPTGKRDAFLATMLPPSESGGDQRKQMEIDAMLTWDQAQEMSDAGIEMGAHTVSHPLLGYEDAPTVERELTQGKRALEERLGKRVRAFAYPNGDWNQSVRQQVVDADYQCAFTTHPAWYDRGENPHSISRVLLHEGNITALNGEFSPAMLALTLAGWA